MIQVASTWLKCWQQPKDVWVNPVSTKLPSLPMCSYTTIDLFQHFEQIPLVKCKLMPSVFLVCRWVDIG